MPESPNQHEITFFVNNSQVVTTHRELSGAAIKELAKVPLDYELYEVQGNETRRVTDNEIVHIHEKQHFRAIPPGTFGVNVLTT